MTAPAHTCTLLIVDSSVETQAHIAEQVERRAFFVITATDPLAVMAMFDTAVPHVIITDLFLPEGGGLALAKHLQACQNRCPVTAMIGDASASSIIQALRAGAVDYLHKPIGLEEPAHALQRARHWLPMELTDSSGVLRMEYIITMNSHPDHIPHTVAWLLKTTGAPLPGNQRLHLRSALQELLLNAVEHGNLEIRHEDKRRAIAEDRFEQLIAERLALPALSRRLVTIHVVYERGKHSLHFCIADEGSGFPWRHYLYRGIEGCPHEEANGRGIFLVHSFFPDMTYNEAGNEVTITVPLE